MKAAIRKAMAKDTIRNASVLSSGPKVEGELVPVRELEGKSKPHGASTCPHDSLVIVNHAMEAVCGGIEEKRM
jgi:hypothetical protein